MDIVEACGISSTWVYKILHLKDLDMWKSCAGTEMSHRCLSLNQKQTKEQSSLIFAANDNHQWNPSTPTYARNQTTVNGLDCGRKTNFEEDRDHLFAEKVMAKAVLESTDNKHIGG